MASSSVSSLGSDEEEGSDDSFAGAATVVDNRSLASERGLPENVKKSLVADIIIAGGIEAVVLKDLTAENKELYGDRKTNYRRLRQVENQVNYWKNKGTEYFAELVLKYSATSPATPSKKTTPSRNSGRKKTPTPNTRKATPAQSSSKKKSSSSRNKASKNAPPAVVSVSSSEAPSAPTPHQSTFSPGSVALFRNPSNMAGAGNEAFIAELKSKPHEKITITKKMMAQPELFSGPFFIVYFTDDPVNHRLYHGFRIMLLDQDICWCMRQEESFQMWWLGNNELMVRIPSASYTFFHDVSVEQKGKTNAGDLNPRIAQAINVTRNAIKSNSGGERQFKYYLLQLPTLAEHNLLDNNVYSAGTENGKVKQRLILLDSSFKAPSLDSSGNMVEKSVTSHRCDIYWNIVIWEPTHRAETAISKNSNTEMEQLAKQFAGAGIVTSNQMQIDLPSRRRSTATPDQATGGQIVLASSSSDKGKSHANSKRQKKKSSTAAAPSTKVAATEAAAPSTEAAAPLTEAAAPSTEAAAPPQPSFWQKAFDAVLPPPAEKIDNAEDIDSVPYEGGTELVDFMDAERTKESRLADDEGKGNDKKKSKPLLGDDEAVWGANGPMGPHFDDETNDMVDNI